MSNRMIFSKCFINRAFEMTAQQFADHLEKIKQVKGEEYKECFLEKWHEALYFRNLELGDAK